jgi:hypothetical protein
VCGGTGPAVGTVKGQERGLRRFALVRAHQHWERHALPRGAEGGPALCGLDPPAAGWFLAGYATWLFLIPCHACREQAAAVLALDNGDTSEEGGPGFASSPSGR